MPKKEKCGLSDCQDILGPGSAEVAFEGEDGKIHKIRVCPSHSWKLMTSPRGTYRITGATKLEAIPSTKKIIIL